MTLDFTPTAGEVQKLREISGAGMMECKRALIGRNISRRLAWNGLGDAVIVAILKTLVVQVFGSDDRLMAAAQELDA